MNRKLAASIAAAVIVGGGGAGIAAFSLGAGASTGAASDATTTTTTAPAAHQRQDRLKTQLDPLVKDGTITQSQEDKVIAALDKGGPGTGKGPRGGGRFGGPGGFGFMGGADQAAVAKALGITTDELKTDRQAGKTIADIAQDKGIDVNTVISALVADANSKLATAVTGGKLTQAQADKIKANETQIITDLVNGKGPMGGGRGFGGHGPGGPGAPGAPAGAPGGTGSGSAPSAAAPTTAAPTTAAPTTTAPAGN